MFNTKTLIAFLVIAVLFAFVLISTDSTNNSLTRLKSNPVAPDFILPDINGKLHALSDYQGKVVVINFWASWCPPCVAEMPSLQRAADKLAENDIPLLGIGAGESRSSVLKFLETTSVSFPLLLDTKSEIMQAWAVPSLPTTIVVNPRGQIALLALGEREWDSPEILQEIISLQQER